MIKKLLYLKNAFASLAVFLVLLVSGDGFGQAVWTYDFGTTCSTCTYTTNSSFSTTFLSSAAPLPSEGGTYRIRRSNNQGGTFTISNPGTSLGTGNELQFNAATGNSSNKFGVYNWTNPTTAFYLKAKIRTSSSNTGVLTIGVGNNTFASDNNNLSASYNTLLTSLSINYNSSGAISSITRRTSSTDNTVSAVSAINFAKNTDQLIEIYANNANIGTTYTRTGSNSLSAQSWDLWIDGIKMSPSGGWAKAGTLTGNTAISGFIFNGESSSSNAAFFYIDDLEYSNSLPSTPTYTVTFDKNHADATGSMANQTASVETALTANAFTRTGYVFAGWNTVASGVGGTAYADQALFPFTANTTLYAQWAPITTTLADNESPVAAGNVTQGINNNILGSFTLAQSGADATLTQATFLIDGNFVNGDVAANGIKLYTSATNNFATATSIGSLSVTTAAVITFSGLTQTLTKDATRYFWVTADIAIGATPGKTINLYQMNAPDLVVSTGTISGSTTVSGTKTIIATAVPTITVTPGTLADFGSVCLTTDSTSQSYDIVGVNLTNDVIVTAPSGFKVRKLAEAYGSSTSLVPDGSGNVNVTIDVIYSPTMAGASGTLSITNSSTGATTKNVSVSGTGTGGTVTLNTVAASVITTTTASSGGNTISTTCGTITAKGVVWGTAANPTIALATKTNDGTGVGDYSSSITGLTENTLYNVRAYATNSHAVTSYGNNLTFTTLSKAPTAPIATTATVNGFTASWTAPAAQGSATLTYTVKIYSNNTFTTQVGSDITVISGTSTVVSGLSSSTTYYYTVAAVNAGGTSTVAGYTTGITTLSGPTSCLTQADFTSTPTDWSATSITYSSNEANFAATTGELITLELSNPASLNFDLRRSGNTTVKTLYVEVSTTTQGGTYTTVATFDHSNTTASSTTSLTVDLSAYSSNSTVFIKFRKASSTTSPWYLKNVEVFCAPACVAPTVALSGTPVTSIAATTVTLNGNVTAQGGFAINTRGFEYSTNSGMTSSSTKSTAATATGTYSENVTGLVANTVYFYRGFAVNDCTPNKTGYTATSSYPTFTTLHNAPTVGTGSGATPSSFTANWTAPTGGAASFTYEIQVDDDNTFASVDFTTSGLAVTSVSATGLTASTTYYYRVRAVNAGGNSAWSSVSAGISTLAPAPEINIKEGVTTIASTGTFAHGNQITTTSGSAVTFTIENTGEAALSVGALSKSGTDAGQFTITQPLSSSVAAGGTTTFTVVFSPTSLGAKTAQLSLVNGDADENPYIINLTGTGTASMASDIITDATFSYSSNINYKNYIATDITTANSVELGQFILRDGGGTDTDNLSTVLNTLSFTVGNSANLQRLAIYDGSTEVAEVEASGTTNFTGLTLTAVDNGIKTFTIRGSFKTAVTDNQRIQLTVASATASATGSGFGTISATTSTTGTDNVIVVTADRLTFTTQPTSTSINMPMVAVVVSATDSNLNVDLDKTGSVAITSTGTLTGTPVTVGLSSGAASFATLTHTVAETGLMLFASASGLITGASSLFDIITVANGTYETTAPGNWPNATGAATWKRMDAGSWVLNTTPASNTTDLLIIKHTITTNASFAASGGVGTQIQVESGGTFNNGHASTLKSLQVNAGGIYSVNDSAAGILATTGTLTVESGGKLIINSSGISGTSAIWSGVENFKSGSTVEINNWNYSAGSDANRIIQNPSIISTNAAGYSFGNLTIGGTLNSLFVMVAGNQTINLCQNDFTMNTSGNNVGFTNGSANVTVGGNVIVAGGSLSATITTNGNPIINILGNLTASGGNINLNQNSSGNAQATINLYGDLQVGATRTLLSSDTDSILNFAGTGDGSTDATTQTIDIANASTAGNILFGTNSGSYVKLINQNFTLGTASKLTVKSGSVFDFGFNGTTPLTISGPAFELESGGTIKITSADGIATSGATGNILTTTRTIPSTTPFATFHYIGKGNQATGNALPATVANFIVNVSGTAPNNEVTLANALTVATKLDIQTGVLNLNEKTTTGPLLSISDDATLKIVGTATFPTFTTRTFATNSIVEYGGESQVIAALTAPTYAKLKVSGTGIKSLATADVEVDNTLEITSSALIIDQDKTLTVTNGITTVDNALSISNGGSLVQVTDVNNASANNNTGKIGVTRITQPMYKLDYTYWSAPVDGTTLHDLSPLTPANRYFSWNPTAVSPAPNWAVITGGSETMSAGKGYIVRAPNNYGADATLPASYQAYTGNFSGKPNNGIVNTPVSGSATESVWNLIGNPYPSAIDAEKFLDDNAILDGTLYFWTHNTPLTGASGYGYSSADYASWNGTGSTATAEDTESNNFNVPSGKIAAGQAFFVRGVANGTAVFNNSMREKGENMQFFRSATNTTENNPIEKSRVWLNLKGANNAFSQTLVGYITNATNDYDIRYDGESFGGNLVTFYSINNSKKLVIQGRALPFTTTDEVPLGYKTTLTGTLIINIDDRDGQLANQTIYLKDNLLNVVHNLTDGPYNFTSTPGTYDDRFVLRYLPGENLDNPTFEDQMNGLTIRKNNADIYINSSFENIDAVLIYDTTGRLLFEKEKCNTTSFKASNLTQSEQMLIVKVRLNNGGVVTKKVW